MTCPKACKSLQSLLNILALSGSRDKYARVCQYFLKFLFNYLKNNMVTSKDQKDQITALIIQGTRTASSLSNFRKILRFGAPITKQQDINSRIRKIVKKEVTGMQLQYEVVKIIQNIGGSLYCLTDHFLFLYNIGVVLKKNSEKKVLLQYYNDWLWMWDCLGGIVANFMQLSMIKIQNQEQQEKEKIDQDKEKINKLITDTTRLAIDIPVIINGLNGSLVSNEVAGICGVISSLIGIYQLVEQDLEKQKKL